MKLLFFGDVMFGRDGNILRLRHADVMHFN